MKSEIKVTIRDNNLSQAVKEEMWEVYRHYYFYDKEYFMQRITKNNFYSFYTVNDKIVGFTGLRIDRTFLDGRNRLMVYFGQTVVHRDYRGKSLLPITAAKLLMRYWKDLLFSKIYFWADALTYKAYLVFAKTVDEMYPSWKRPMTPTIKALVDFLGKQHYGDTYCSATGTVQKAQVLVNDTTTQIPLPYAEDNDIRYYQEANPKFRQGHGLITISPMNRRNVQMIMKRFVKKVFALPKKKQEAVPVLKS
jgi:hypothetical protein